MSEKVKEVKKFFKVKSDQIAKKDFKIVQNAYEREIKKGDDLSDIPGAYLENLKTEGVL